jgi:hypothetical protein
MFLCPVCRAQCLRPEGGIESLKDDVPEDLHAEGKDGEVLNNSQNGATPSGYTYVIKAGHLLT